MTPNDRHHTNGLPAEPISVQHCVFCGYDLRHATESSPRCPECGRLNSPDACPPWRVVEIVANVMIRGSFLGLFLCWAIRQALGHSEREFMSNPLGAGAVFLFGGCFILGLIVVFPCSLVLKRRAGQEIGTLPRWIVWLMTVILVGVIVVSIFMVVQMIASN